MVVICSYLERENYKVLKFRRNNFFKRLPLLIAPLQLASHTKASDGRRVRLLEEIRYFSMYSYYFMGI